MVQEKAKINQAPPNTVSKVNPQSKKKSGISMIIVILFLVVMTIFFFFFNIAGIRTYALSILKVKTTLPVIAPSATGSSQDFMVDEKKKLAQEKNALDKKSSALDTLSQKLKKKESDLVQREAKVAESEKKVAQLNVSLTTQVTDLNGIVQLVDTMDTQNAANIVTQLIIKKDQELAILLLNKIKKNKASEILGLIDPKDAAVLLQKMKKFTQQTPTPTP